MKKPVIAGLVLVVLGGVWGGGTVYIGQQTEAKIRENIELSNALLKQHSTLGKVKIELVNYTRQFLSASGSIKLSSTESTNSIEKTILPTELTFNVAIQHGPLFLTHEKSLGMGMAYIQAHLNQKALSEEVKQQLEDLFGDKPPFIINTTLGFNNQASYQITLNPLTYSDDEKNATLSFAGAQFEGVSTLTEQAGKRQVSGPLSGKIGKLELKGNDDLLILLPESDLKAYATQVIGGALLDSQFKLDMPGVSVKVKELPEAVSFGLSLSSSNQLENNDTQGTFNLTLSDVITPILPTSQGAYEFGFKGFNTEGLAKAREHFMALEPIQQELNLLDEMLAANQVATEGSLEATETESNSALALEGATEKLDNHLVSPEQATKPSQSDADVEKVAPVAAETPVAPEVSTSELPKNPTEEQSALKEGEVVNAIPDDQAPEDTLEEAVIEETPEVQAKRVELQARKDQLMKQGIDTILGQVLQPDKSQLKQVVKVENKLGLAQASVDLTYVGTQNKQPLVTSVLEAMSPAELLRLVKGSINLVVDRDLFPMAALFLDQPFITKENNQFKLSLELAGDKLILNQKSMSLEEFMVAIGLASATPPPVEESTNPAGN